MRSLGVLLAVAAAVAVTADADAQEVGPRAQRSALLDQSLESLFALDLAPGMAVVAVIGDQVAYLRGFGFRDREAQLPVTAETMFYIASTTKSFTAFVAALLDHRAQLDLDAPLSSYLPALQMKPPLSATTIMLRDLLTMTHGIRDGGPIVFRAAYTGDHSPALLLDLLGQYEPSPTGRAFVYGNLGYNIAGFALDARFPIGWKALVEREVFDPLGMVDTHADLTGVDRDRLAMPYAAEATGYRRLPYDKTAATMHAAGGHVSTARDLARWVEAHLNGGQVDGREVLPPEVVAATHRKHTDQDRTFAAFQRFGWGLGWDLGTYDGDTLIHRFGSYPGFRSHVSFMPSRGVGVVVLVNEAGLGSVLADAAATTIYDALLQKPNLRARHQTSVAATGALAMRGREGIGADRARRAARPQDTAHPLAAYEGTYRNAAWGCMSWRVERDTLRAQIGVAVSAAEVYDGAKDQFRVELAGGGQVVTFRFQGPAAVGLTSNDQEFTRAPCR